MQDHTSNTMYWSTPSGETVWNGLRDSTLQAAELARYKSGDVMNSGYPFLPASGARKSRG